MYLPPPSSSLRLSALLVALLCVVSACSTSPVPVRVLVRVLVGVLVGRRDTRHRPPVELRRAR